MSWSSPKKKEGIVCTAYFVQRKFLLVYVFYLNLSLHKMDVL